MTYKEKLKEIKKLADAMYYAAQYLTTDASRLHKAMDEYHQFIIHEWREEPVSIWHDGCEIPKSETNILMIRKDEKDSNYHPIAGYFHSLNSRIDGKNWGYYNGFCYNEIEAPCKWAYIDDFLALEEIPPKFPLFSQKKCMYTKDDFTDEDRKVLCDGCKEECEYAQKKEPVSKDLEVELNKYIKDHFTIDKEQLDRFGIEEKDYMYSMDKSDMFALVEHFTNWQKTKEEPVSEDICNQCEAHNDKDKCDELVFGHKCPIVTTSEDLEEASEEYTGKVLERTNMLIGNQPVGEEIEAAFKAGAKWQKQKEINEIRAEIKRRYEHHLGCMEGSRDDTYPEISHAHHCAIKTELFEILCFLDVLEGNKKE